MGSERENRVSTPNDHKKCVASFDKQNLGLG